MRTRKSSKPSSVKNYHSVLNHGNAKVKSAKTKKISKRAKSRRWSDSELEELKKMVDEKMTVNEISKKLGRSFAAVSAMKFAKNLRKFQDRDSNENGTSLKNDQSIRRRRWTDSEILALEQMMSNKMSVGDMAKSLNRTKTSIILRKKLMENRKVQVNLGPEKTLDKSLELVEFFSNLQKLVKSTGSKITITLE